MLCTSCNSCPVRWPNIRRYEEYSERTAGKVEEQIAAILQRKGEEDDGTDGELTANDELTAFIRGANLAMRVASGAEALWLCAHSLRIVQVSCNLCNKLTSN